MSQTASHVDLLCVDLLHGCKTACPFSQSKTSFLPPTENVQVLPILGETDAFCLLPNRGPGQGHRVLPSRIMVRESDREEAGASGRDCHEPAG